MANIRKLRRKLGITPSSFKALLRHVGPLARGDDLRRDMQRLAPQFGGKRSKAGR